MSIFHTFCILKGRSELTLIWTHLRFLPPRVKTSNNHTKYTLTTVYHSSMHRTSHKISKGFVQKSRGECIGYYICKENRKLHGRESLFTVLWIRINSIAVSGITPVCNVCTISSQWDPDLWLGLLGIKVLQIIHYINNHTKWEENECCILPWLDEWTCYWQLWWYQVIYDFFCPVSAPHCTHRIVSGIF